MISEQGVFQVKVISRNVRGLAMDFVGASGNSNRSVIEQAEDYLKVGDFIRPRGAIKINNCVLHTTSSSGILS